MQPSDSASAQRGRLHTALRNGANWSQLAKFCAVGATGYAVNLAVFALLTRALDVHYLPAAVGSFVVAVTNNYLLNRSWTFRPSRGHVVWQGARFLVVSVAALGANLVVLAALVSAGAPELVSQAVAIVLVTPINFVGNKLWSFRR
jgi:dolichol-phosphate mannosyltransferase